MGFYLPQSLMPSSQPLVIHIHVSEGFLDFGKGAVFRECDRSINCCIDPFIDAPKLVFGHQATSQDGLFEELDRIEFGAVFVVFRGNFIGLRIAFKVAEVTIGLTLHQARPLSGPGARNRLMRRFIHGSQVVPVYGHARHIIRCGAVGDILDAAMIMRRRGLGIAVVLGHKNDRQLPDCGQVEALVQGALFRRPVTKEADGHLVSPVGFCRQAGPTGQRRPSADDTVGPQHAFVHIGNMHGATFALANPRGLAEQLSHHAPHVHPFCNTVAMSAMGRGHIVSVREMGTNPDSYGFFPGIEMHKARDFPLPELSTDPGFKHTDELHTLIDPQELVFGNIHTALLFQ